MDFFNELLAAVSVGLGTIFPGIPVHSEEVPEEVPQRCFLTGFAGDVDISLYPHGGRMVTGTLDITYLAPERGQELEIRRELNTTYCNLALGLRRVTYGGVDLILGRHRRTDDGKDGTLHDLVSFSAHLFPVDDTPLMQDISVAKEEIK